jgi:hypothetical protein
MMPAMARTRSRIERIEGTLGTLLARAAGTSFALAGVGAGATVLALDDFSLADYWPVLAIAALLLLAAWACFRARPSFLDMMSGTPLSPSEAAARRRDVAVDDQRGREDQRRDSDQRAKKG